LLKTRNDKYSFDAVCFVKAYLFLAAIASYGIAKNKKIQRLVADLLHPQAVSIRLLSPIIQVDRSWSPISKRIG
jgi:hypothetical protein